MIKVRMRKNDEIDLGQLLKLKRRCGQSFWTDSESWQTNSDAREENRISENLNAEEIDEHCRVTKPRERNRCIAPVSRLGLGGRRSNPTPALNRPLTEKMTEPTARARSAHTWLLKCFHKMNQEPMRRRKTRNLLNPLREGRCLTPPRDSAEREKTLQGHSSWQTSLKREEIKNWC
jgi:hypothetical protein